MEHERLGDRVPTYTEQFKKCFPFYLSIGMTYEQFWEGDCALPIFYRQAFEMKQKSDNEMNNFNAWLQGRYFAEAIAACFSKGSEYPESPFGLDKQKENMTEEEIMLERADKFRQFVKAKKERTVKLNEQH